MFLKTYHPIFKYFYNSEGKAMKNKVARLNNHVILLGKRICLNLIKRSMNSIIKIDRASEILTKICFIIFMFDRITKHM